MAMAMLYRTLLLCFLAALLVFTIFPEIDLATAGLFYEPGKGFPISRLGWVEGLRDVHMVLAWVVGLASLFLWLGLMLRGWRRRPLQRALAWLQDKGGRPGAWVFGRLAGAGNLLARGGVMDLAPRRVIYVLVCLIVGPGLLTNVVLKEHWGRARPSQVTEFGGARTFTPALIITDQCPRNCSFVSGEVSLGFWWLSFAFAARPGRRRILIAGALAMGTTMVVLRVAAGGHFLSDAIFAALLTIAVCALLRNLMAIEAAAPAVSVDARPV